VLGTSNKTELLLGYGTLHGDMASALNPLGDLYKMQVWSLAEAMDIPEVIVQKRTVGRSLGGPDRRGRVGLYLSRGRSIALFDGGSTL